MPAPKAPVSRSDKHAWLITGPLVAVGILLTLPVVLSDHARPVTYNIQYAPILLLLAVLASYMPLRFEVRRQALLVHMNDVPLLLALFYLSPEVAIAIRVAAATIWMVFNRFGPHKIAFNAAGYSAGVAAANLVVFTLEPTKGSNPWTWFVLGAAIVANNLVTLAGVSSVMATVQGIAVLPQFLRLAIPGQAVMGVNIVIGLVMLLTLQASKWASVLLVALAVVLGVVYRAYAQFLRQHKSLTEMYALTRDIGATNHDGTLPDVLLSRVRALMAAESATLWLPEHGRHQEVFLSARFEYPGLLDNAPTPDLFRQLAMRTGETVFAGPKSGPPELRAALQEAAVKDVIVVPLRSGGVAIGTLEVAGRLGEQMAMFGKEDVRLIETLSAHAGVTVENTRLVDRLQFDANHDALTGLVNRRRMLEALGEAMTGRGTREVVAVLLFDVVALRQVNDSLGHIAGDRVLVEVARRLRGLAPQGALVARVGDDEFAVELRTASADAAVAVADTLRAGLRDPMVIDALTIDIDTNVGVSIYPDHGAEPEALLQRAHVATHVAKSRGVVQLFNAGLQSRSVRRVGLAADLQAALTSGELEVYFQPKVALRDRRLVGVECLARWEHPVHGQVAPPDFVAVAEHTGQLSRLNGVVLGEGMRRARQWADAGRPLAVSVNLSTRTFGDADLPLQVAELLEEHGVPADRLILEISEEKGLLGDGRTRPTLDRLRDLGVRLSVDDFGVGRSSFADLSRLPVQEVKIDRTFVQGMATSPSDLAIVRTIVDMARHFGLDVVAEGVESELTLGLLEDMQCGMGQGFLFSRALPYERFESWLQVQADADPTVAPAGELRWLRAVP